MKYLMKIEGCHGHNDRPEVGEYLVDYSGKEDAQGYATLVTDPGIARAKRFSDFISALEFWKQQSKTVPTRDTDGRPNRPLTAYTISIVPENLAR